MKHGGYHKYILFDTPAYRLLPNGRTGKCFSFHVGNPSEYMAMFEYPAEAALSAHRLLVPEAIPLQ